MLNGDGKLLELNEKYLPNMKYSEVAHEDVSMKMLFWFRIADKKVCKDVCVFQALVSIDFSILIKFQRRKIAINLIFFVEKLLR